MIRPLRLELHQREIANKLIPVHPVSPRKRAGNLSRFRQVSPSAALGRSMESLRKRAGNLSRFRQENPMSIKKTIPFYTMLVEYPSKRHYSVETAFFPPQIANSVRYVLIVDQSHIGSRKENHLHPSLIPYSHIDKKCHRLIKMADSTTKSTISLSKITKLKNSDGWRRWHKAIKQWIIDQDLDLLQPISLVRPEGIQTAAQTAAFNILNDARNQEIAVWTRKQLKAVNSICSVCENRASNFLEGIIFLVTPAIAKLEAEFKPSGDATFSEVHAKWLNLSLYLFKSVDDFVEEFEDTYARLRELDPTYQLPRVELIAKFIAGLGQPYESWNQTFEMTHNVSTENISLSTVQGLARKEEQRINRSAQNVAMMAAKSTSITTTNTASRANKTPCSGCGASWHEEKRCFVLHPDLEAKWKRDNPEKAAARELRQKQQSQRAKRSATTSKRGRVTLDSSDSDLDTDHPEKRTRFAGLAGSSTF